MLLLIYIALVIAAGGAIFSAFVSAAPLFANEGRPMDMVAIGVNLVVTATMAASAWASVQIV